MEIARGALTLCFLLSACCLLTSSAYYEEYPPRKHFHLRFYSRPSWEAEPQYGIGFKGHLNNFFKSGAVGVDFFAPGAKKISDHARKFGQIFPPIEEEVKFGTGRRIGDEEMVKAETGNEVKKEEEVSAEAGNKVEEEEEVKTDTGDEVDEEDEMKTDTRKEVEEEEEVKTETGEENEDENLADEVEEFRGNKGEDDDKMGRINNALAEFINPRRNNERFSAPRRFHK